MNLILEHIPAIVLLLGGIAIGMVAAICWMGWRLDKADWQEMNRDIMNQLKRHLKDR